jgi:hypothetical protein
VLGDPSFASYTKLTALYLLSPRSEVSDEGGHVVQELIFAGSTTKSRSSCRTHQRTLKNKLPLLGTEHGKGPLLDQAAFLFFESTSHLPGSYRSTDDSHDDEVRDRTRHHDMSEAEGLASTLGKG